MPKYYVTLQTVASVSIKVTADDPEAALEAAFDEAPSGVCAQCSGWGETWSLDLGEWDALDFTAKQAATADVVEEVQ